ncbi:MAG: EAL domain-containing protein [Fusobacteriaceae bacterium]|nr:EAL domain-containing protein [Fusobacteriaceae bacterium]MBP6466815.1 EAL domain-containing protein [Fusobacteriaceae bacterium]MBP9595143.1 EAL domain-containing protein [Fusobacteriaceae bacterium]MBU9918007.1 EAL domain-containing protein [Fusobacteriaceae bacterium]
MRKNILIFLTFVLLKLSSFSAGIHHDIKIAVFPFKPLIYQDEKGNPNGFFYDIIEHIAETEGFETTYVFGTWENSLEAIKTGKIDLITSLAYTKERDEFIDYTKEGTFSVWSQVYTYHGTDINNIFDLNGKKVGIVKSDFSGQAFIDMAKKLEINCNYVYFESFSNIFENLDKKNIDAGVSSVTNSYAMKKEFRFEVTPIIFNPFTLYFGVPKGKNQELLRILDLRIKELKSDKNSYYYKRLNYWIGVGESSENELNKNVIKSIVFLLIVLFLVILISLYLKSKVKKVTSEILKRTDELEKVIKELNISEQAISGATEGICITDISGNILKVNNSFCQLSGYEKEELLGKNPRILKSGKQDAQFYLEMWESIIKTGSWRGEIWDRKKNGEIYPKWLAIDTIVCKSDDTTYYLGISTDITKLKNTEEKVNQLAYYDDLTKLPNRRFFYEILERVVVRTKKHNKLAALLLLDLDRFKMINDTLGHSAGDIVLKITANRLKKSLKKSDTIARVGGDEFAIILEDVENTQQIIIICQRIIEAISKNIEINNTSVLAGGSIGIVVIPVDDTEVEGLFMKSDAAMFHAKELGKGQFSFYSKEIQKKNKEFVIMENKLREALNHNEFSLFLQPKVLIENNKPRIIGAEALIRLTPKEESIIFPDRFIKIAEDTGLIIPIGKWIIEDACKKIFLLKKQNINTNIAINVSVRQLENFDIVSILKHAIERNNISPWDLEIEITESAFSKNIEKVIEILIQIRNLGIKIGIDDFGTGYSSLSSLLKLPIDYLKIDKSFIDRLGEKDEKELVSSIIAISKNLNLGIVAEGVETKNQIDLLSKYNSIVIQGYYFSKPLNFEDFIHFYKNF